MHEVVEATALNQWVYEKEKDALTVTAPHQPSWNDIFTDLGDAASSKRSVVQADFLERTWAVVETGKQVRPPAKKRYRAVYLQRGAAKPLLEKMFQSRTGQHYAAIELQVEELRRFAAEQSEAFDETSARSVLLFCKDLGPDHEPAITLLANGNLRAVWQNPARDQIGIQFFPDGLLQYVMLRDRDGRTLKALGEDVSAQKIRDMVRVQGLTTLWFHGGR